MKLWSLYTREEEICSASTTTCDIHGIAKERKGELEAIGEKENDRHSAIYYITHNFEPLLVGLKWKFISSKYEIFFKDTLHTLYSHICIGRRRQYSRSEDKTFKLPQQLATYKSHLTTHNKQYHYYWPLLVFAKLPFFYIFLLLKIEEILSDQKRENFSWSMTIIIMEKIHIKEDLCNWMIMQFI